MVYLTGSHFLEKPNATDWTLQFLCLNRYGHRNGVPLAELWERGARLLRNSSGKLKGLRKRTPKSIYYSLLANNYVHVMQSVKL